MSSEMHLRVLQATLLLNLLISNMRMMLKTFTLLEQSTLIWSLNLKESLMTGASRSLKHLKALTLKERKRRMQVL